jgi:hypothetical protein
MAIRVLINVAHNVHFAFAARAGAGSPEGFEAQERLRLVIPLDGEFVANPLDVHRFHAQNIRCLLKSEI